MDALKEEAQRFRIETGSLAYQANTLPSTAHQGATGQEWDDTDGPRDAGARAVKNKRELHAEQVASVIPHLLSPAFQDELSKLEGPQLKAYLDSFLQKASLSVAEPAARKELTSYLKQVLNTIHGIQVPDSPPSSASSITGPRQDVDVTDQLSDRPTNQPSTPGAASSVVPQVLSGYTARPSPYPVPSSASHHTPGIATTPGGAPGQSDKPQGGEGVVAVGIPSNDWTPTRNGPPPPPPQPAGGLAAAAASAATAAAALSPQRELLNRLAVHGGGRAEELAAIISAAASAATTAAAAAMAGVWSSASQQQPGTGPRGVAVDLHSNLPPRPISNTAKDGFHVISSHPGPPLIPHQSPLLPNQATPQPRGLNHVPAPFARAAGLRVVKLGQPRITAKAVPVPGGDSPMPAEFQAFRNGAAGTQPHGSSGVSGHQAIPQVNPLPPPPIHDDPFISTTRFLPAQHMSTQVVTAAAAAEASGGGGGQGGGGNGGQGGGGGRHNVPPAWASNQKDYLRSPDPLPRPPFRSAGIAADAHLQPPPPLSPPRRAVSPQLNPGHVQARAAAQRVVWDVGHASAPHAADGHTAPPAHHVSTSPRGARAGSAPAARVLQSPDAGLPRRDIAAPPAPPVKALITMTPKPERPGRQQPGVQARQAAAQQPARAVSVSSQVLQARQPVPLPQELRSTFQHTLDYLADPDALPPPRHPALTRGSWPPADHNRHVVERSTAEREVAGQLGGVLEYGRLVQQLEQARQQSKVLRGTPITTVTTNIQDARVATSQLDAIGISTSSKPGAVHMTAPAALGEPHTGLQQQARPAVAEHALTRLKRLQRASTSASRDSRAAGKQAPAVFASTAPAALEAARAAAHVSSGLAAAAAPVLPPAHALWEDEAAWLDSAAYVQALQREIWFRTSQPVAAQSSQTETNTIKAAAAALRPARHAVPASAAPVAPMLQGTTAAGDRGVAQQQVGVGTQVDGHVVQGEHVVQGDMPDAGVVGASNRLMVTTAAGTMTTGVALQRVAVPVGGKPRPKVHLAFGRRMDTTESRKDGQAKQPGAATAEGAGKSATANRFTQRSALQAQAMHHLSHGGLIPQQLIDAVVDALLNRQPQIDDTNDMPQHVYSHATTSTTPVPAKRKPRQQAQPVGRGSVASSDAMSRVLSALASVLADEDVDLASEQDLAGWAQELLQTPTAKQLIDTVVQQQHVEQHASPSRVRAPQQQHVVQAVRGEQPHGGGGGGGGGGVLTHEGVAGRAGIDMHGGVVGDGSGVQRAGQNRPHFLQVQDIRPSNTTLTGTLPPSLPHLQHVPTTSGSQPAHVPPWPTNNLLSTNHITYNVPAHPQPLPPLQPPQPTTTHLMTAVEHTVHPVAPPTGYPPLPPQARNPVPESNPSHPYMTSTQAVNGPGSHQDNGVMSATVTRAGLFGDAGPLGVLTDVRPSHPAASTLVVDTSADNNTARSTRLFEQALLDLLVEEVLHHVVLDGQLHSTQPPAASQPGVVHVHSMAVPQPPLIPIVTDAEVSYQLVRQVLREELDTLLAPISQDEAHGSAAQGPPSQSTADAAAAAAPSQPPSAALPQPPMGSSTSYDTQAAPVVARGGGMAADASGYDVSSSTSYASVGTPPPELEHPTDTGSRDGQDERNGSGDSGGGGGAGGGDSGGGGGGGARGGSGGGSDADMVKALQAGSAAQAAALAAISAAEQAAAAGRLRPSSGGEQEGNSRKRGDPAPGGAVPSDAPLAHNTNAGVTAGAGIPPAAVVQEAQAVSGPTPTHQIITMQVPMPYPVPYLPTMPYTHHHLTPSVLTPAAQPGLSGGPSGTPGGAYLAAWPWAHPAHPTAQPLHSHGDVPHHVTVPPGHVSEGGTITGRTARVSGSTQGRHVLGGSSRARRIPGLDQLLYDSTELLSSDDDDEDEDDRTSHVLHQTTLLQGAATAAAVGRAASTHGSDHLMALTHSFQEASLETLLAPAPVVPGMSHPRATGARTAAGGGGGDAAQPASTANQALPAPVVKPTAPAPPAAVSLHGGAATAVAPASAGAVVKDQAAAGAPPGKDGKPGTLSKASKVESSSTTTSSSSSSEYSADEEWDGASGKAGGGRDGGRAASRSTSSRSDQDVAGSDEEMAGLPVVIDMGPDSASEASGTGGGGGRGGVSGGAGLQQLEGAAVPTEVPPGRRAVQLDVQAGQVAEAFTRPAAAVLAAPPPPAPMQPPQAADNTPAHAAPPPPAPLQPSQAADNTPAQAAPPPPAPMQPSQAGDNTPAQAAPLPAPGQLKARAQALPGVKAEAEPGTAPMVMHVMSDHAVRGVPLAGTQQQQGADMATRLAATGLHSIDAAEQPHAAVSLTSTPPRPTGAGRSNARHGGGVAQGAITGAAPPPLPELPPTARRLWRPQAMQPTTWSSNDSLMMDRHSDASGEVSSRSSEMHSSLIPAVHAGQTLDTDSSDVDSSDKEATLPYMPLPTRPPAPALPRVLR